MGATTIEKILARTAGRSVVRPGEIVVCRPDMVVQLDLTISTDGSWYRPLRIFDPERVALIFDHSVPAPTIRDADGMSRGRAFAREFGLKHFFDVGEHGISHQIVAEHGLAVPGELLVCPDSHTCAVGALNCAGRGVGPIDTIQAMTKGVVWYQVAPTIRYELTGRLPHGVYGKDVLFYIAQTYGHHANVSLEFGGAGLADLPLSERWVISTMAAELGAEFALFDPDDVLLAACEGRSVRPPTPVAPDPDADYADVRPIDLSLLEPYVVLPDAVPNNGLPIGALRDRIEVQQAFIGSCANGKLEDLRVAARILRGRRVAPGVRLIITPASQKIYLDALREGIIDTLMEAGAVVTNATCGACFGHHMGVLGPGETCITASTRNFKGRMGAASARIFMGSPATVAASAVAGSITDPRGYLA